jgi:subtilisin family serine protease
MPLYSTGVPGFLKAHPTYDGRGVLLAILDSGIDAGIAGLDSTSDSGRKILDLRDFSGEGRIDLSPISPKTDSVLIEGVTLSGFGRVIGYNAHGPWYGGVLREQMLGSGGAADVDGNGTTSDVLPLVVTRASDGWILFADRNRDGSLAGEQPIRDYLVGHDTFGWSRVGPAPLTLAANLGDTDGKPVLDLFFDSDGHGSHVSGIASGFGMYGVQGFNGVAPGAQVIGLKVANGAHGGISTTGSMLHALEYAIGFAARRRMPLVVNLSFGIGNEIEGTARIDAIIDSVLAEHPDVVFTVSAGNEGPGLSTITFPGSADRVITVGAVLPGDPDDPPGTRVQPVAYFSSRGGELAKPDLVAPGTAYSTVPLWNRGKEISSGTSMAAPHAAGLAAILLSGLKQSGRTVDAHTLRQALMVTAHPIADQSFVDQGAGLPDVGAAFRWLGTHHAVDDVTVRIRSGDSQLARAAYRPAGLGAPGDTVVHFILERPAGLPSTRYTLRSNAPWLSAAPSVVMNGPSQEVTVTYHPSLLPVSGTVTGVVSGWPVDTTAGPVFRLVNTVAMASSAEVERAPTRIAAGSERRLRILADSGQPFEVITRVVGTQPALVFIHEPTGMPLRGGEPQIAGAGQEEVSFKLDGRDVVGGAYEVVAVAPPTAGSDVRFDVRRSPIVFDARREANGVVAHLSPGYSARDSDIRIGLVGGEREVPITARGSDSIVTPFVVPAWAKHLSIDISMAPAQWSRFTDLGFALYDSAGAQLEGTPLNYAVGRMDLDLDDDHPDLPVTLRLFPGFADPESHEPWHVTLSIRVYAEEAQQLQPVSTGVSAPGNEDSTVFRMIESPWPQSQFFYPLGTMEIKENGAVWARELPLPEPSGPLMR